MVERYLAKVDVAGPNPVSRFNAGPVQIVQGLFALWL